MDTGAITGSIFTAVVIIIIISAILFGIWIGAKIKSSGPSVPPTVGGDKYNQFDVDDIEFDNPDPLEPASVKPFGGNAGAPVGSPAYDNFKTYKKGDVVTVDGKEYEMTNTIGAAGYAPAAHPASWKLKGGGTAPVQAPAYDNFKTYKKGDVVSSDGKEYEMTNTIGAAGYAPAAHPAHWKVKTIEKFEMPTSGQSGSEPVALPAGTTFYVPASFPMESTAAAPLPYDNGKTYKEGDLVSFKNDTYKMIKMIGAAGYAPTGYPENWKLIPSPVKAETVPTTILPMSGPQPYDNVKQYNLGDVVLFNGKTYKMTKYLGQSGGDPIGYYASYWTDTSLLNKPVAPPPPKFSSPTNFIMTGDDIVDYVPVLQMTDFGKGKVYLGQNGSNIVVSNQEGVGMALLGSLKDYNNMTLQSFQQLMLRNIMSGRPPQSNKSYVVKDINGNRI